MKKAEFSLTAKAELFEAVSFIAAANPFAAKEWRDRIEEACLLLTESPSMGRERPELGEAVRSFPVGRFVIFYRPSEAGIEVAHVARGAMDVERLFQK